MRLDEAITECNRWLDHLDTDKRKAAALAKVASDLRAGKLTHDDARRKAMELTGPSPTVYDGARLADAVRLLLRTVP